MMDTFLLTATAAGYEGDVNIEDIPFIKTRDSLVGLWWNSFNRSRMLAEQTECLHQYGVMVHPYSI